MEEARRAGKRSYVWKLLAYLLAISSPDGGVCTASALEEGAHPLPSVQEIFKSYNAII